MGERITKDFFDLDRFNAWLLAERSDRLVHVFALLCDRELQPVVIFCGSGKDRTGLVSALSAERAGVADDDVRDDYALTQELMSEEHLRGASS